MLGVNTLDYENIKGTFAGALQGQLKLWITATDGAGEAQTQAVIVTLTDVPESPSLAYASLTWDEGESAPDDTLGLTPSRSVLEGVDYDASDQPSTGGTALTYVISANVNNGPFLLTIQDCFVGKRRGERCVRLSRTLAFDYESQDSYPLQVKVTDAGGRSATTDFTISVRNINEKPNIPILQRFQIREDHQITADIATIHATDPDGVFSGTYVITGDDANVFTIDGGEGRLELRTAVDAEIKSTYTFSLTVTDEGVATGTAIGQTPLSDTGTMVVVIGNVVSFFTSNIIPNVLLSNISYTEYLLLFVCLFFSVLYMLRVNSRFTHSCRMILPDQQQCQQLSRHSVYRLLSWLLATSSLLFKPQIQMDYE
jgi:hypothetical protein